MYLISHSVRRTLAVLAICAASVVGLAPVSVATNATINCYGGAPNSIGNANTGSTSMAYTWAYTRACGNIGITARTYIGGGSYGWQGIVWYGSAPKHYNRYFDINMTASRHYYTYYNSPTVRTLDA